MKKNTTTEKLKKTKELADKQGRLTKLEDSLIDICEELAEENTTLATTNQTLKNELNRLKGEQGQPNIRPQTKPNKDGKSNDHSSEGERKRGSGKQKKSRAKSGSKKSKVSIHHTVKLEMTKTELPPDAVRDGVKETLRQDIQITANNTLFIRQQYYSKSENKYYLTPLPPGYEGEYGPNIKSWSNVLYSANEMTTGNITTLFNTAGILISKSTTHGFIIKTGMDMAAEKSAITKAGFQSTSYQHLDDTSSREAGKNRYVNVVGNEYYSVYFTLPCKDRLSIIKMLSLDDFKYAINPLAIELMRTMKISNTVIDALKPHISSNYYSEKDIEIILDPMFKREKKNKHPSQCRKLLCEAMAIAAYRDNPYAISQLIVDDAPQFKLITAALGLCWVHEGRHYKKLNPLFKKHKATTKAFITKFWIYYHQLLAYKAGPSDALATALRESFKTLFSTQTGYDKLDKQIALTLTKIEPLLLVLQHPEIPVHNNPAELMARYQARARDIHLHTMSEAGTLAKDTLATLAGTAKKLAINLFHYLLDRITRAFKMKSLAELISIKAALFDSG